MRIGFCIKTISKLYVRCLYILIRHIYYPAIFKEGRYVLFILYKSSLITVSIAVSLRHAIASAFYMISKTAGTPRHYRITFTICHNRNPFMPHGMICPVRSKVRNNGNTDTSINVPSQCRIGRTCPHFYP